MKIRERRATRTWPVVVLALVALLGAACGNDDGSSDGGSAAGGGGSEDTGAPGDARPSEITIGSNNPMTGPSAQFGTWFRNAGDLAADEINAQGGEDGVKVEVDYQDNQNLPEPAVSNLLKLTNAGVRAVIVGGSSTLLAQAPLAVQEDVLLVNAAGSTPQMRGASPLLYSIINDSGAEVRALAELAVNELGLRRIAIVGPDNDMGKGATDIANEAIPGAGGEVVAVQTHPQVFQDVRPQLIKIKDADPDAIFTWTPGGDMATVVKQAEELGIEAQWFGINSTVTPAGLQAAGPAAEGFISARLAFDPSANSVATRFAEAYEAKYNEPPSIYAAMYYDAVHMITEAAAANGYDATRMAEWFAAVKDYEGATGTINFDEDHVRVGRIDFAKVTNGAPQPFTP